MAKNQSSSVTQSCLTLCRPHGLQHTRLPCPSPTPGVYSNSCPIESVMPSNHLILCRPFLLSPSIFPSIRVFFNESALRIRWPKDWSLSISPSNEYSGLISFSIDCLDLLAVQVQPKDWSLSISPSNEYSGLISFSIDCLDLLSPGLKTPLKSLLQHQSSKASVLQCSAFFIVQFSHPYMTAGKTIALTRQTIAGKGNVSAF